MSIYSFLRVTILSLLGAYLVVTVQERFIPVFLEYKAARDFKQQYIVENNNKFKILMVWAHGLGEHELITRYKIIAPQLDLEYRAVSTVYRENNIERLADKYAKKNNTTLAEMAIAAMQPDIIITVQHSIKPYKGAPNYRVLDVDYSSYISTDAKGTAKFSNPEMYDFDGFLTAFTELEKAQAIYEANGKQFYGMNWYPTSYKNNYKPSAPTRLFYIGGEYGIRHAKKYESVIKMLDKQEYLDVAAAKFAWKHELHHLRPQIPFDGFSLIDEFNKTGVALILHDEAHLHGAVPTGRIFEAAAGNSVIISDENGFVKQHFGDNVFYVDVTQDAETMFRQIDQHMQWILKHPVQAKQMANKCHDIFLKKFTLEAQLQKLIQLHKNRINQAHKPINIHLKNNFEDATFPKQFKELQKQNLLNFHWLMIKIDDTELSYYAHLLADDNALRVKNIIATVKKILEGKKYHIPNGNYFISYEDGIHQKPPIPVIGFAGTKHLVENDFVILMPDFEALAGYDNIFSSIEHGYNKYPWHSKINSVFWRGSATGADIGSNSFPRKEFLAYAKSQTIIDAGFTGYTEYLPQNLLKDLSNNYPIQKIVTRPEHLAYKFLIDIDGNSCTYSHMAWILYSNSLLMKHQSNNIQWYYNKIKPYEHYIPVKSDFSDLLTQYEWAISHDTKVQQIVKNAQQLAKEVFSPDSIMEATAQAFNQYHNLTHVEQNKSQVLN